MAVLEVARDRVGSAPPLSTRWPQEATRRSVSALALNVDLGNPAARPPLHADRLQGCRCRTRVVRRGDGPGTRRPRLGQAAEIERGTGFHSVTPRMVVSDVKARLSPARRVRCRRRGAGRPSSRIRLGNSLVMVSAAGERDCSPAFLTSMSMTQMLRFGVHWQPARLP